MTTRYQHKRFYVTKAENCLIMLWKGLCKLHKQKIFDANICTKIIRNFCDKIEFFVRECPNICGNAIPKLDYCNLFLR